MALQPLQPLQQFQPQYPMMQPGYQNPLLSGQPGGQSKQQQQNPWYYKIPGVQTLANIGSGIKESALGTPGSLQEYTPYQPHQLQALDYLLGSGLQQYQNPYQGFEPLAQQARQNFNQTTVPGLAERFTSMGGFGTGALSSPVFASQLGAAGSQLDSMLAAQAAQYGFQNRGQALNTIGMGLSPQSSFVQLPGTQGWLPSAANFGTQAGLLALMGII